MAAQKNTIAVENHVDTVDRLIRRDFALDSSAAPRPLLMGIDPGLSGAVAVVNIDTGVLVDLIDLPTFKTPSQARKQGFLKHLDPHALSSLLDAYAPHTAAAILEEPGAMPGQGLGSTFRFGHSCGLIHGVLAGHYVPVLPVKPAVWKSALGLGIEKDDSRRQCSIEFPAFASFWQKQRYHDRAEAALLTVYGRKYLASYLKAFRR